MIGVAVQTLRARWISFLGTVVALVLGVAQVAAMGLLLATMLDLPDRPAERFSQAPAVVFPTDPDWDPAKHDLGVRPLAEARGVSSELLDRVRATGEVVVDRSFYAQLVGGSASQVGHPWSVARFGGYELASGRPPADDREIVVGGTDPQVRPGDRVTVLTATGVAPYTVSGVTRPVGFEEALFFTDTAAARISPRIEALVAFGPLDAVRAAAGTDAEVLTGQARHQADASEDRDREAFDNTVTLLPVMASIAGSTAIFVVAATFAFAVAQRRREVALLRTVGATPAQVRRMVLAEAFLVGTVASAAGAALGLFGARLLARWLISLGISPPWYDVVPSWRLAVWLPLAGAFLTGVTVSVVGALAASWRAGRVRPIEALRDAAVDDSGATPGRLLLGGGGLLAGVALVGWVAVGSPETVLSPNSYIWTLLVPVLAVALLAPVAVGPLTRLLMRPFARSGRAGAMLVRASALTARRRTAATAAPVLLTVGLSLSLLAATDSINEARDEGLRNQVSADFALTPDGTPGISQEVINRVAGIDGVRVAAPVLTTIYTRDDDRLEENDGLVVDPVALADTFHLDVVDGALSDLDDDTIVVPEAWGLHVNAPVEVLMADGSTPTLRVAATYRALRGQDVAYLSSKWAQTGGYARNGLVRRAYLTVAPGSDQAATLAAVRAAVTDSGARLMSTEELVVSESAFSRHLIAVRQRSVAGIVVLFCFIAIVNTLLMATADRRHDLAVLRLAGATPRQVLAVFVGESLLVAGIGVVLALLASALSLAGLWVALTRLFGTTPLVVPYGVVAGIAAVAALLAVLGTVLPVGASLRARAVARAGVRE